MSQYTPSEAHTAEVKRVAHMGRVVDRAEAISLLQSLLTKTDKEVILTGLRSIRMGGKPLGFEPGFEQKDLSAIQEAMREVIVSMEADNQEVPGLASAIHNGLLASTALISPEQEGPQLEADQVEWLKQGIEARFERSKVVNAPLLELPPERGVPAFPSKEATLRSALKQLILDPELVAYMMEEGFIFQMILETPSDRLDLQEVLINGQPHLMDTPDQDQQDLDFWGPAKAHLQSRPSVETIEWKWNFVQGPRLMKRPQKGEDFESRVEDRVKKVRRSRPSGIHGMRRFEWAALAADYLEQGIPLDIRFCDGAKNTPKCEERNVTLLDGEGEFKERQYRYLVGGGFAPSNRNATLNGCPVLGRNADARIRGSVYGSIEAQSGMREKAYTSA